MKKTISFIESAGSGGSGLLPTEELESCIRASFIENVVYCLQGNGIDRADPPTVVMENHEQKY